MAQQALSAAEGSHAIRRLESLSPLDVGALEQLHRASATAVYCAPRCEIRTSRYEQGSILLVLDGWLMRQSTLRDGRRQISQILLAGETTAIHGLEGTSSLVALTRAHVALLSGEEAARNGLAEALRKDRNLEVAALTRHSVRLGRMSALERLMDWLVELGMRQSGSAGRVPRSFELPIKQELIADALGLTSVHVNRTIQALRREELIELRSGVVRFLDLERCLAFSDLAQYSSGPSGGLRFEESDDESLKDSVSAMHRPLGISR